PTIKGGTAILNGDFAAGAMVNVSGGAWLAPNGSKTVFKVGDGGTATLGGVTSKELAGLDLRGYAAGSGASLNLRADGAIQIGGTAPSDPSVLYLPATLLAERGFPLFGLDGGDIVF